MKYLCFIHKKVQTRLERKINQTNLNKSKIYLGSNKHCNTSAPNTIQHNNNDH